MIVKAEARAPQHELDEEIRLELPHAHQHGAQDGVFVAAACARKRAQREQHFGGGERLRRFARGAQLREDDGDVADLNEIIQDGPATHQERRHQQRHQAVALERTLLADERIRAPLETDALLQS